MKSKSLNLGNNSTAKLKQNRSFDFVNLYKSVADTGSSLIESTPHDNNVKESHKAKPESSRLVKSPNKRKKKEKRGSIDIAQINIESSSDVSTLHNESKVTSTPVNDYKSSSKPSKVKSIIKNCALTDDAMDGSKSDVSPTKTKKRNKSVSFMLEDNDELIVKKTKSSDTSGETENDTRSIKVKANKIKKHKKHDRQDEKENEIDVNHAKSEEKPPKEKLNRKPRHENIKPDHSTDSQSTVQTEPTEDTLQVKRKQRKLKKTKKFEGLLESTDSATTTVSQELPAKTKKTKKKKHQDKSNAEFENGEPAYKSRKKEDKPDVVEELENLSIGDNAHTLTNLLDEMTVVDKEKRKKLKQKFNKNKKPKGGKSEEPENPEEATEKVKWRRRKWNKDSKADVNEANLETSVIVDNLPLSLLFSYKKVLSEYFVKYGLLRGIGIAEVYPTEVSQPVFTTTVTFYSDSAADQALQEDNTTFQGSRIRVKRPLPPTQTTVVVRSYAPLSLQLLSSTFNGAGRIRNIRQLVKGKHSMGTYFIEFDGPESVERAMKLATNLKIAEKKVYVSKFVVKPKKKQEKGKDTDASDADQSEGSQD